MGKKSSKQKEQHVHSPGSRMMLHQVATAEWARGRVLEQRLEMKSGAVMLELRDWPGFRIFKNIYLLFIQLCQFLVAALGILPRPTTKEVTGFGVLS